MLRKQKEQEIAEIEDRIEGQFKSIQNKIDNELEPGKRRAYNELLSRYFKSFLLCHKNTNFISHGLQTTGISREKSEF